MSWQEIAAAHGKQAHAGMQLNALTGSSHFTTHPLPGVFDQPPLIGSLPQDLVAQLAAALGRHTSTPERCWFAIWNGFGAMPPDVRSAPTFATPNRKYHLLAGPVASAADVGHPALGQSPNLWWPDDHAWCVATEIDFNTTYIACGDTAREDIVALPALEARPIDPRCGVRWDSDLINPV
ncbi:MAG: hypothetical protein M3Z57_02230 [Candidatus Dormibacteraeota bacterium]|nr:hypothetical protein [Candidatus Dormibacteraeota bacterium]